jgi:hypothetical protein
MCSFIVCLKETSVHKISVPCLFMDPVFHAYNTDYLKWNFYWKTFRNWHLPGTLLYSVKHSGKHIPDITVRLDQESEILIQKIKTRFVFQLTDLREEVSSSMYWCKCLQFDKQHIKIPDEPGMVCLPECFSAFSHPVSEVCTHGRCGQEFLLTGGHASSAHTLHLLIDSQTGYKEFTH